MDQGQSAANPGVDWAGLQAALTLPQFPRSARYDLAWLVENEMGPCSAWLAEFLAEAMVLRPGMKVLDLGCGKAVSSIFLAQEFGVQVWAADLWIDASDNLRRIDAAGMGERVFPLYVEAHALPFARGFFDAIVSLDAFHYFGTDELYLSGLVGLLKPGGQIGVVVPGVVNEFGGVAPERLRPFWEPYLFSHHSPEWWAALWGRSECVDVQVADAMPHGYENWLLWDRTLKVAGVLQRGGDVALLEADGGNFTWVRAVATRRV